MFREQEVGGSDPPTLTILKRIDMTEKSAELLRQGIQEALGSPRGDPDDSNLRPAACMAKVLMDEGFEVSEDTLISLRKDNIYNHDFLAELEE